MILVIFASSDFRRNFVLNFVGRLVAKRFATKPFVRNSSTSKLLQLIVTNFLTFFRQSFVVARCCGKTFCHTKKTTISRVLTKFLMWQKGFATLKFCKGPTATVKSFVTISLLNNGIMFDWTNSPRRFHDHFFVAKCLAKWIAARITTRGSRKSP